jgi:seryl-tRNA synthetase
LLFAVFGFYTHTNTTLEEQASTIKEVKQDVVLIKKKINEADVYQGVSQAEYTALKDKVTGIEKTVDNIDAKLDKVLIQTK